MFHIIIPTYNREKLILRALKSVLNQKYNDYKIYIIDDGSTDNTKEILKPYLEKYNDKITYKYKENGGVGSARNVGIELALKNSEDLENDWYLQLDSDDELTIGALKGISDVIFKYDIYNFFIFNAKNEKGKKTSWLIENKTINFQKYLSGKYFGGEGYGTLKLKIFKNKVFRFYENINGGESLLWLNIIKTYEAYTIGKVFRIYYQNSVKTLSKGKLCLKTINNSIQINKLNISLFEKDLIQIKNYKLLGVWYMVLGRMYTLKGEKGKGFRYFLKGFKYNCFDIRRIGAYILSLLK